jgi:hypothetical protein
VSKYSLSSKTACAEILRAKSSRASLLFLILVIFAVPIGYSALNGTRPPSRPVLIIKPVPTSFFIFCNL